MRTNGDHEEPLGTIAANDHELALLEELTRYLSQKPDVHPNIREHAEAARFYRLGGMPEEYHFSLKLLEELLPDVQDEEVKSRLAGFLHQRV